MCLLYDFSRKNKDTSDKILFIFACIDIYKFILIWAQKKKLEALKLNNKIKFLQFRGSMILRMRSWIIWRIDFCVIRIKSKLETLYCTRINVFEDLFHFYLEPYELLISSYSISISNNSARSERKIPLSDDLHSDADPVAFRASLSFVMYHFYECK